MRSFINEIWNHNDRNFARALLLLYASTIVFYISFLIYAISNGQYSFVHDDEFNYIGAAKLFAETGSVQAPLSMMEEVSKLFGANWYGISYNIFYGTLYYLFGEHAIIFILTNFVFLILLSVLVHRIQSDSYRKLFALELVLLSYPVMIYSFMFFPEILHIFLALIQFFLLFKISQIHSCKGNYRKLIVVFIVCSILFSLFRVTSVFWIAGIIPFCKNGRQFVLRVLAFILSVLIVMTYMHYFIAPAFVFPMGAIESLKEFQLTAFFNMWSKYFVYNLINLFTFSIKEPHIFILLLLFAFALFKSFRAKEKLYQAAALITLCYFGALISFYNTTPFYFTKQTAVLYPLLICTLSFTASLSLRKVALLGFIIALPFTIDTLNNEVFNRKKAGQGLAITYKVHISELKKISALVDPDKSNVIEFLSYEHKFPRYIFYDALPMSNTNAFPITYTASVYNESLYPDKEYNGRFPRYGLLDVAYVLSRDSLQLSDLELLYHSPYYNLYKDNR